MGQCFSVRAIFRTGMLLCLFLAAGIETAAAQHVIVDTDYVAKNKDRPGVVLVDARAAGDYKKGRKSVV